MIFMRRAIELDPDNYKWHDGKGFVLERSRKPDEAINSYKQALKLNPRDDYAKEALERLADSRPPW